MTLHSPSRRAFLRNVGIAASALYFRPTGFAATARPESPPGLLLSEPIFERAPFPQCHASTLVETPGGLLAAWFGGTKEGNPDVGIWLARNVAGKWSAPVEVANGAETESRRVAAFNPVLFQVPDGPLLLFYKTGKWWAYIKRSTDHGLTWSKAERMPNGLVGPVKNKPVLLPDGAILSGSSLELPGTTGGAWRVHFERSTNGGGTWQLTGPVNDGAEIAAIQPTLLLHPNHRVQALGRTQHGKIFEIWSADDGKTWGRMALTDLPNPNSGIDAVTLRDGRQLLVYNHSPVFSNTNKGLRAPLNVAISRDGRTWQAALVLESLNEEHRKAQVQYQFSYPAVIQSRDGLVHITYTWHRQRIQHAVIDPTRLALREIVHGVWPTPR